MNRAKEILKSGLAWLLILMVMSMLVNSSIFLHSHKLNNGVVISHAHPFSEKSDSSLPYKSHHHTKYELVLINMVNSALFLISFVLIAFAIFAIKSGFFVKTEIGVPQTQFYILPLGRAPPLI